MSHVEAEEERQGEFLSKPRIAAALRRWAGEGLDASNPAHVDAYLLARQLHQRPRAEQVLAIANTAKSTHSTSAALTSTFQLIPRDNFQGCRAPDWLEEWLVEESLLWSNFMVPDDTYFSAVFICDSGVPTTGLKRLKQMTFDESLRRDLSHRHGKLSAKAPRS